MARKTERDRLDPKLVKILLIAYCFYVLHSKKEPPLNIRLFKDKNFSASVMLLFLFGMFSFT